MLEDSVSTNAVAMHVELPPPPLRIYVNRDLRMDSIQAIGFDMDYTLVRYRREKLEELAYQLTLQKLIAHGYPEAIAQHHYDHSFVIRGLTVDKQLGNIIKLDKHHYPGRAYRGRSPLPKDVRRGLYRQEKLRFVPPRFAMIDTLFSLPEMCLYADLIDHFDANPHPHITPAKLFDDVRFCMDIVHQDNSLKSVVQAHFIDYLEPDPLLARTLHKLRSSGKKLFLLTNSLWDYTHALMHFLLHGQLSEYPTWQSYFEKIVVGAAKPLFFTGNEPLVVTERKIYQGGNLKDFEKLIGFSGEEILYVGDHIYGDILRSKKTSLWRTALIVEELEDELRINADIKDSVHILLKHEQERVALDKLLNIQRQQLALLEKNLGDAARTDEKFIALKQQREQTRLKLKDILSTAQILEKQISAKFNANWGMVFKERRENSRFGEQVTEYACIYTSRVSNFLAYSSYQYFRSLQDLMPHERELF